MLCLVAQFCATLNPMDCSPPGSCVLRGFSRQEYWSGLPWSTSGDLSNPGIEPRCPPLQADSTREAQEYWSEYPIPSPGNPTKPGIDLGSPESQAHFLPAELPGKPNYFPQLRQITDSEHATPGSLNLEVLSSETKQWEQALITGTVWTVEMVDGHLESSCGSFPGLGQFLAACIG